MSSEGEGRGNSLRARILALYLVTICVVALLTLYVAQDAAFLHSREQLAAQHLSASRVIADRLETRATLLHDGLEDAAANFSVKQLVASADEDPGSLVAALENYRQRLGGDFFAVFASDGRLIVSSIPLSGTTISPEEFAGEGLTWVDISQDHFLLKAVAMRFVQSSPRVNAWLAMGQLSNSLIDERLSAMTGMEVTLLSATDDGTVWGSTLESTRAGAVSEAMRGGTLGINDLDVAAERMVVGVHELDSTPSVLTVSSQPRSTAYVSYESLLSRLAVLLLLAAVFAAIVALRLSASITQPISTLVLAANRISRGEDALELPPKGTREVNVLTESIVDMQKGIRERESEINRLAYFDPLTGLPNRNQFENHVDKTLTEGDADSLIVALMDVDHFKEINDTVGHAAGDRLLEVISQRIRGWAQPGDFVARMGGDEFAVVSSRFRPHRSELFGEELASVFDRPFSVEGLQLDVNISIGLATFPDHGDSAQPLLRRADIAMYSCKGSTASIRVFSEELDKHSVQRLSLMSELKEALADGQLSLHYQPKLSLRTGKVQCVESLIRWEHPEFGFIQPDEFIGLAEQTGSIRIVTHWALKSALEQQAAWKAQGLRLGVAVNISALDLSDMSLPAYVGELQTRLELAPEDLTLEITESVVMEEPETAMLALKNLRRMGVQLSIDDFGTGFSSMAQLRSMPVNELKIDKTFVLNLSSSRDDQTMVRTVLSLAENLGLSTVAEGVEDVDAMNILREMGCGKLQGYYLSKPLPVGEFEQWIRNQQ